jgi:flagellar hook-associated protein 1
MSGLFSIFNVATRGMSTQQTAINVTSHNIANANTEGYSRQRATIETTRPFGMPSLNNAVGPGQIGTGAQVSAIQRVRDSFLDYQVRTETSTYGQFSAKDKFLSEVESIFNEPSETGISTLVGKFFDSWQTLAGNPQSSNTRTIVVQQAAALADSLNQTSTQLEKLKKNANDVINSTVFEANDILNQISQLNQQIVGVKVSGQMPNDLMDRRDLLIDTLSSKFNFKIEKKNFEGFNIIQEDGTATNLVKAVGPEDVMRLSYVKDITKTSSAIRDGKYEYSIRYYENGDTSKEKPKLNEGPITLRLTDEEYKNINKYKIMLTDSDGSYSGTFTPQNGELFGYAEVQEDINNYVNQIDQIAKAIAFSVNALHSGVKNVTDNTRSDYGNDINPFFVNGNSITTAGEEDITAKNIKVNQNLIDNVMLIETKYDSTYGSTNGSRALAIAQLRDKLMNIQKIDSTTTRADLFDNSAKAGGNNITSANGLIEFVSAPNGIKIDSYFKDIIARLGVQSGEAQRMVKNQETLLSSFEQTRESVSGVSLDEEMANLIQYQHAYQANAKIIATVDELLDVVINGLKR